MSTDHGETDWNRQQRFQGQIDVPLNATGHIQAAWLASERPDTFYTSDLRRARETGAPLARAWGHEPVALTSLLEQHFGILEGQDVPTIQAWHPELWRLWLVQHEDFAAPGGESTRQFHTRVWQAVQALAVAVAGRRLAVVTHGGMLDMLWRSAHALPLSGLRECAIPNTGINRLRWTGGALHVDVWADDAHLSSVTQPGA